MGTAEQLQVSYPECETHLTAAVVAVAVAGMLGSGRVFCTDDHATPPSVPVHTHRDIKVNSEFTHSHKADLNLMLHTGNSVTYLGWVRVSHNGGPTLIQDNSYEICGGKRVTII